MFIEHLIYAILYILRTFHTFFRLILINNNNVQTLFLSLHMSGKTDYKDVKSFAQGHSQQEELASELRSQW